MTVQTGALSANGSLWYIIGHDPGRRSPQHSNYPPGVSLSAAMAYSYAGTPVFRTAALSLTQFLEMTPAPWPTT